MRDEVFMRRALELAARAQRTYPNPKVGAVVVRYGEVIGEGYHRGAGSSHAEIESLAGIDAAGATMYVTLEPCIHQGRTPPCAPAVADAGISRVVVATEDPDERVRGRGLALLQERGVKVDVGVLEAEARELNAPFLLHRSVGRSFLSLKLATSLDGRIAAADGTSRWITGSKARRLVHERRRAADAVLVGAGTVLADDPALTVRDVPSDRHPLRVVVDAKGRVDPGARLFSEAGDVLMATTDASTHEHHTAWKEAGAEVLVLPSSDGKVDLNALLRELGRRDVVEVFCEGGPTLATSLLAAGLVDRLELHRGGVILGSSGAPLFGDLGIGTIEDAQRWVLLDSKVTGNDVVDRYVRRD